MYTIMIMYFIKLILILVFNICVNTYYINSGCKCCCCGQPKTPELITSNNKKTPTKQKDNITKQFNINDKKEGINKINNKEENNIKENDKNKDKDKIKPKKENKSKEKIKPKEGINKINKEEVEKDINDNKNEKKEEIKEEKKKKEDEDGENNEEELKKEEEIKEEDEKEEKKEGDDDVEENNEEEDENNEEDDEKNEEDDEKNEEDDEKNKGKNTGNKENNRKEELKTHFKNILTCLNILYDYENYFIRNIIEDTDVRSTVTIKKNFNEKFYLNTDNNITNAIFNFISYVNLENNEKLDVVVGCMDIVDLERDIDFFENVINQIVDLIKKKYEDNLANYTEIKNKFTTIEYIETHAINSEYENLKRQVKVTISSINLGEINEDDISIKEIDEEKLKKYILGIKNNINIINKAIIEYFKKLHEIAQRILKISGECSYCATIYNYGLSDKDKEQIKESIKMLDECIKSEDLICSIKKIKK